MKGLYRDSKGRLRASPRMFPVMLADFLETDVRENKAWCAHLMAGLGTARAGERFSAQGNLYGLSAGQDGAVIRNLEDERAEPLWLHLDELGEVLAAWFEAIQAPPR